MTEITMERLRSEAADLLDQGDWAQSDNPYMDPVDGLCLVTALQSAWGIHDEAAVNTDDDYAVPDGRVLCEIHRDIAVELGLIPEWSLVGLAPTTELAKWNDTPGRTKTEVVDALKGGTDGGPDKTG